MKTEGFKATDNGLNLALEWMPEGGFVLGVAGQIEERTRARWADEMQAELNASPLTTAMPKVVLAWEIAREWFPSLKLVEMGPVSLGDTAEEAGESEQ